MAKTIFEVKLSDLHLPDNVVTCYENTSLFRVVTIMQQSRVGSVVIVKDLKPVGIFTERDFLLKLAGKDLDFHAETVGGYMTPNPVCMTIDETLFEAMWTMRRGRFRHLIITDGNGLLKKVLSIKDISTFLTDWLQARKPRYNKNK